MSKIIITESQLKKLMEQNTNSVAMDLDIYSQPMDTPSGNPNDEVQESAEQIMDYLKELIAMMKGGKELGAQNEFKVVCYGHAGDGNLHIRINHPTIKKSYGSDEMNAILKKLFELVKDLGGTISGEHGIGLIQKSYMPVLFDEVSLELMRGIKNTFDPNHILNSGKIFDYKK